jgi:hypothetical protein
MGYFPGGIEKLFFFSNKKILFPNVRLKRMAGDDDKRKRIV